jgi:hypothetical protein
MNSVTIAIPGRWKKGSTKIHAFFTNKDRLRTASIKAFKIRELPPVDEGQIWALESSLDPAQAVFVDSAITAMNVALNASTSEGWRMTKEITHQAERDVEDLESIRAATALFHP